MAGAGRERLWEVWREEWGFYKGKGVCKVKEVFVNPRMEIGWGFYRASEEEDKSGEGGVL
jgi:hypothetical protein